jgi:polar amino acid transport system permease protein
MPDERARLNVDLPPPEEEEITPAGPYERFINWAVELPWWAIILTVVAVAVLYSMATSEIYRRAVRFLTDDPQWSTTDLYDAVLIVGDEIEVAGLVENETTDTVSTVLNQLLKTEANTKLVEDSGFLISESDARMTIRTDDGALSILKKDVVSEERQNTGDGVRVTLTYVESETVTGVITGMGDRMIRVRTVDEEAETFPTARILSRETVGMHECGEDADKACEEGEIVTIQRAGETISGELVTLSNTNIRVDTGENEPREVQLRDVEYYVVASLTRAVNDAAAGRAIGAGDQVTVGYLQVEGLKNYLGDVSDEETVMVPLVYADGEVEVMLVPYDSVTALLEATDAGDVDGMIYIAPGPEHPEIDSWLEEDANDVADLATLVCKKGCAVEVKLLDDELTGRVAAESDDSITVVTTEAQFTEIPRDTILEERKMQPGDCAVNNRAGCDEGVFLTLVVTFKAYALALVIGLIVGIMRVPTIPTTLFAKFIQSILTSVSTLYVEVVRGIPLLVILIYAGFVVAPELRDNPIPVPEVLETVLDAILSVLNLPFQGWNALGIYDIGDLGNFPNPIRIDMNPSEQAIVGLAFGYGAFIAEIFRAGIQSINRGQMEAARSLGMSYPQAMRYVVLPQAIRVVLPPLGNDFIAMLKDSALISVLALPDLLQLGRLFVSRTFRAFEGYNTVAVLYLLMTLFLSTLVRIVERRTRLPG